MKKLLLALFLVFTLPLSAEEQPPYRQPTNRPPL